LQLVLEVGLAGCGEERHLWYSAWAFIYGLRRDAWCRVECRVYRCTRIVRKT
jgi:hypothetical protein